MTLTLQAISPYSKKNKPRVDVSIQFVSNKIFELTREDTSQGSDDEAEDDSRACKLAGHHPSHEVHAGAHAGPHAQGSQVRGREASLKQECLLVF